MRSVEAEGSTIDEAIERALDLLHVDRSQADIEILESASKGLLGFGGKPARVRATVRSRLVVSSEEESGAGVSRETPSADSSEGIARARAALEAISRSLGVDASIEFHPDPEQPTFRVLGEGAGIMIGRHGQTLDAIEYLVSRIASHQAGGLVRIAVDVEGYRGRRQESLEQMALRAADQARTSGRPVPLSPMSPRDRRIIHVALDGQAGISTRSEGEGPFRCVVVVPNR